MALRLRRGTDTQRQSIIFAEGELIYVTDTKTLFYGDGTTLGGIPVSSSGFNALSTDLDLNSFEINGEGAIDITGTITADIINATQFIGDGSGLTNLPGGNLVEGETYTINISGTDSSIIIDSETNTVLTSSIVANSNFMNIKPAVVGQQLTTRLTSTDNLSVLKLNRTSEADLSLDSELYYGSLHFERSDINGDLTTSLIAGRKDDLIISSDNAGLFPEEKTLVLTTNGNFGFGTYTPSEKIVVEGNAKINGFVQFGSVTTTERSEIVPQNGMVIYNSTDNRFQGYQNNTWINLDNGTPA